MIAGRLTQDGDLLTAKSVDTRLPLVTNGLLAHYPMDGTTKGIGFLNKINYSTWVIGTTGSQTGFAMNGTAAENSIVEDTGPFGEPQAIWQALGNDVTSDADGGWDGASFSIDPSKLYRFSVWVRRKAQGNGSFYLGLYGSGAVYGVYDHSAGAGALLNTNPYFEVTNWNKELNQWYLVVGYVHASTDTNYVDDTRSGWYKPMNSTKISNLSYLGDFRWDAGNNNAILRTYLFYSTDPLTNQQWAYPRVDLCDGTEPSLDDLLFGEGNVINPATDTNNTKTFDGTYIETSTTNLAGTISPIFSNWNGLTGSSTLYKNLYNRNSVYLKTLTGGGVEWYTLGANITATPSTVYTVSARLKYSSTPPPELFYLRQYRSDLTQISEQGIYNSTYEKDLGNGFKLVRATFTTAVDCTSFKIHGYEYTANKQIWLEDVQIEQKQYATSFTSTSRLGSGGLAIKNLVRTGDYTISFKCKINMSVGATDSSSVYNTIFTVGDYYTNNSWTIMDTTNVTCSGNYALIRKGNAAEWAWATGNVLLASNFNNTNTITVTRGATDYRIYTNGVYTGFISHLSTTMQDLIWVGSRTSGVSANSTLITDFSIYNRVLTDDEIKTLAKGTHSLTKTNLITKSVESKPVIPTDSFYFPLDLNGKDSMGTINPSEATNFTGDNLLEAGTFVGGSSVNLLYNAGTTNLSTAVDIYSNATKYDLGSGYYKFVNNGVGVSSIRLQCNLVDLVNAGVYSCSVQYKDKSGSVSLDWCDTTSISNLSTSGQNGVLHIIATRATYDSTYKFLDINMSTGSSITLFNPQIEYNIFKTPFVAGTRGISSLEYNLNSSIGLDWNADWSICYFKKPIGTSYQGATLTGFNIESLGCNGNSIGGGYIWWGKTLLSDTLEATTNPSITPSIYFNNWQCVTLVKSGTTLTIETWINDKIQRTRTVTLGTIAANYYVTQYGYDFKLSGWDNANECWGYYKHLTILKRAMTAQELSDFRKTKMSSSKNGIRINSSISTHETLV